jgi:Co/Zn/Cd efflux system component
MRAAHLHVFSDTLGSVAAILSALFYMYREKLKLTDTIVYSVDPILW